MGGVRSRGLSSLLCVETVIEDRRSYTNREAAALLKLTRCVSFAFVRYLENAATAGASRTRMIARLGAFSSIESALHPSRGFVQGLATFQDAQSEPVTIDARDTESRVQEAVLF